MRKVAVQAPNDWNVIHEVHDSCDSLSPLVYLLSMCLMLYALAFDTKTVLAFLERFMDNIFSAVSIDEYG